MFQTAQQAAIRLRATVVSPFQRQTLAKLAEVGRAPLMSAFYHRVADCDLTPWTITTAQFNQHLDFMTPRFEFIDLQTLQRRVDDRSDRAAIAITFDDGYADNCRHALPTLIARGIPLTYFVSTDHIRYGRAFQHDLAGGRPLATNTPAELRRWAEAGVQIGGHTRDHADLSNMTDAAELRMQIIDDRKRLQDLVSAEIPYFAFPFGLPAHMHAAAVATVREAGYRGYCSAFGGYNCVGGDSQHIRRFHGDPEFSRLVNWLSLDRRKLLNEPQLT